MQDNSSAHNSWEYDQKIKMTLPYYEEFYKQTIDIVRETFSCPVRWLDIGCGTGKMAEVAYREIPIKAFMFCDNSESMLDIAKERFSNENASFTHTSILDLDVKNKYDVVTAIQVFHYLQHEKRIAAVTKCYEALDENGIFISFENFAPFSELGTELSLKRWKSFQISMGKSEAEAVAHISRYGVGYHPITLTEHLEVLHQCGFTKAEVIWLSNMQVGVLGIK